MTKSIFLTLIASALFAASVNAATKPVPGDGSTQTFSTGANGQWTTDTYSVTLAGPGILRVWDGYCFGDRYEVTIDGAVVGTTSEGSPAGGHCNALSAAPTPEFAWGNKAFSRGVYSLTAGDHTFQFTTTTHPWGGPAYFAVGSGSYVDPNADPIFIVVDFNKVGSRAEAGAACKGSQLGLSSVTAALFPKVKTALLASTKLPSNSLESVAIGSWEGTAATGPDNLALSFTKSGTDVTLGGVNPATGPLYPLCQTQLETTVPSTGQVVAKNGQVAIVGPPGSLSGITAACKAVGLVPYAPAPADFATCATASALAFAVGGAGSRVWISGWGAETNPPVTIGAVSGGLCVVNPVAADQVGMSLWYACQ